MNPPPVCSQVAGEMAAAGVYPAAGPRPPWLCRNFGHVVATGSAVCVECGLVDVELRAVLLADRAGQLAAHRSITPFVSSCPLEA